MKLFHHRGWIISMLAALPGFAADLPDRISLPPPQSAGGKPLMQALAERRTSREISSQPISSQQLGNLLWAAFGVNRPATAHRTAPSAMNSQEIDLYVATTNAVFVYEPKTHDLRQVAAKDLRPTISSQLFVNSAPVVLVYIADLSRLSKAKPESRTLYAGIDAGCIVQNVYLYCASENLATVVFELDRKPLTEALALKPHQQIIIAQAVGHPAATQ